MINLNLRSTSGNRGYLRFRFVASYPSGYTNHKGFCHSSLLISMLTMAPNNQMNNELRLAKAPQDLALNEKALSARIDFE